MKLMPHDSDSFSVKGKCCSSVFHADVWVYLWHLLLKIPRWNLWACSWTWKSSSQWLALLWQGQNGPLNPAFLLFVQVCWCQAEAQAQAHILSHPGTLSPDPQAGLGGGAGKSSLFHVWHYKALPFQQPHDHLGPMGMRCLWAFPANPCPTVGTWESRPFPYRCLGSLHHQLKVPRWKEVVCLKNWRIAARCYWSTWTNVCMKQHHKPWKLEAWFVKQSFSPGQWVPVPPSTSLFS